ncbi:unnamed protein product [Diatraea saccharalis]|uniref:Uncharacterized protein n=1 Tax=Diatraea saccharalis TaxID=40085 RepID=A0A9N9RBR4_9NEOP|nr:unnamed protein product [Diatraea saccharalis]
MIINENKQSSVSETCHMCSDNQYLEQTMNDHVGQNSCDNLTELNENSNKQRESKKKKVGKKRIRIPSEERDATISGIDKNDLDELRSVYKKCKAIVNKIETKYGYLLNLQESDIEENKQNADHDYEATSEKCECSANKKIIFDDDGKVITKETVLDKHICPKKLKRRYSDAEVTVNNIQVEYETSESLPDDINELSRILQNPDLETTYRNKVIDKVKIIKQDLINEIKFNKKMLIEKCKSNPSDIFEFSGSNLDSLPGYL